MKSVWRIAGLIFCAFLLLIPVYGQVAARMSTQQLEEKLGSLPGKEGLKILAMGHRALVSEWIFFRVMTYYGGRIDQEAPASRRNVDYPSMYYFLDTSTYIDPYNIDSYYFAQAILTWEFGMIREVNVLLDRGMEHRTWDFYLPFFAGFNSFYFLKDYKEAGRYMERASRIAGDPLFANLAARFLYESDETDTAISFLKVMIEKTWNQKVRRSLETRLGALEAVRALEKAARQFEDRFHRKPGNMHDLLNAGLISRIPQDPYGGMFYLDDHGRIRTTSKFAIKSKNDRSN